MAAFSFRAQVMHTRCSASTCDGGVWMQRLHTECAVCKESMWVALMSACQKDGSARKMYEGKQQLKQSEKSAITGVWEGAMNASERECEGGGRECLWGHSARVFDEAETLIDYCWSE